MFVPVVQSIESVGQNIRVNVKMYCSSEKREKSRNNYHLTSKVLSSL